MDRASILGDAIEYVKELQQQVKDLQEELLMDSKANNLPSGLVNFDIGAGTADHQEAKYGGAAKGIGQCPVKIDSQSVTVEIIDRQGDHDLTQPMQVSGAHSHDLNFCGINYLIVLHSRNSLRSAQHVESDS